MPIYVDNRKEDLLVQHLTKLHYPVEVVHLDSGDIQFEKVGIERKTINDLVNSINCKEKGHNLWQQLRVLKDTYEKPYLLLEGFLDWENRQVSGIMFGVVDGFRIPYLNSVNSAQSAVIVGHLYERYGVARTSRLPPVAVRKGYSVTEIKCMMLQTIPHIGGVVARRILEVNPTIFSMRSNTINSLDIQGLRRDAKEYLIKVLTE
jgi:ERCC4-type nuclease